jgi:hypothetical protein
MKGRGREKKALWGGGACVCTKGDGGGGRGERSSILLTPVSDTSEPLLRLKVAGVTAAAVLFFFVLSMHVTFPKRLLPLFFLFDL